MIDSTYRLETLFQRFFIRVASFEIGVVEVRCLRIPAVGNFLCGIEIFMVLCADRSRRCLTSNSEGILVRSVGYLNNNSMYNQPWCILYVGWPLRHTNDDQPVLTANVWRVAVKRVVRWLLSTVDHPKQYKIKPD